MDEVIFSTKYSAWKDLKSIKFTLPKEWVKYELLTREAYIPS
jgi:hypothetical protein